VVHLNEWLEVRGTNVKTKEEKSRNPELVPHTLAIVFADIVGFTALLAMHGDLELLERLREFRPDVERLATAYSGRCIKFVGDTFLAVFEDVENVLPFAAALSRSRSQQTAPANWRLRFSLHLATVFIEQTSYGEDILGAGVNIAAHLTSSAEAGQMVVSRAAWQALPAQQVTLLGPMERVHLKGMAEEMEFSRVALARV
jgi:class 3 adenylate cyclase